MLYMSVRSASSSTSNSRTVCTSAVTTGRLPNAARQPQRERATRPRLRRDEDVAALLQRQAARQVQAESRALDLCRGALLDAAERLEQLLQVVLGDADALVRHHDGDPARLLLDADTHLAAVGRVLERVGQEVA